MPKVSDQFGPIYVQVTLDASGNGQAFFQAVGSKMRITNISFAVSTTTSQAQLIIYKGQVAQGNRLFTSQSGSTGGNADGNVDLFDGEFCVVAWTGGDVGAIATATFTGEKIPLDERLQASHLTFTDPVAAGDGSLIFNAIKSPNYVTGVSGWAIFRNGNVEFASGTFRGSLVVVGSGERFSVMPVTGFFAQRDPDDGSYAQIRSQSTTTGSNLGGALSIQAANPTVPNGNTMDRPGIVGAITSPSGANDIAQTQIFSPRFTGKDRSFINLLSQGATSVTDDRQIILNTVTLTWQATSQQWSVYGVDAGRGWVNGTGSNISSAAIGNTETVVLTVPSFTYKDGRTYRVEVSEHEAVSVANNTPLLRIRKTNTAGLQLGFNNIAHVNTGQTGCTWSFNFFVSGSDVTAALVLTAIGSAAFTITMIANFSVDIIDLTSSAGSSGYAIQLV